MPAFLLTVPEGTPGTRFSDFFVMVAADEADARAIAKAQHDGDGDTQFDVATVSELVDTFAGSVDAMQNTDFHVAILDASPLIDIIATGVLGAISAVPAAGGTAYVADDIVTLVGGTFTRAATFKVTGETGGVVDTVVPVDPGEYTVFPGDPVVTSGGTGSGLTLTVVSNDKTIYNLVAEMVGLLNAQGAIANAEVDFSASPPLLTIAAVADNLGDKLVVAEVRSWANVQPAFSDPNAKRVIPSFVGTIVDQGIVAAVLTAELTDPLTQVVPVNWGSGI